MKKWLLVIFLFIGYGALAQITITNSDFPSGGDTALVSLSSDFGLDYESTGPDYNWNFESLVMTAQRIDTFFDIDDASITYQLVFNNGWFDEDYQADYYTHLFNFAFPETDLIPISNPVGFTKIETDRVEAIGVGLEIGGFQVPIKNEVIDIEYPLPLNYGNDWVSNSFFEVDLNPAFDGILRRHQERSAVVDGWGQLNTPFSTFEVLRVRSVLDFTDSLRITFGGEGLWIELPTPNQVVYTWWADNQKVPVLKVVAQEILGTETITSVEYKDRDLSDVGLAENQTNELALFPNPANESVQVNSNVIIDQVSVYDLSGALVSQFVWNSSSNELNVASLAAGTYVLELKMGENSVTKQFVVK